MKHDKQKGIISRRKFLSQATAGAGMIAFAKIPDFDGNESPSGAWPSDAIKYSFHMIGQAHIDPVWLWPWTEGISVVHSTFRSALDRMMETSDFCFTASSAQFYDWVEKNDPEMLKEIRQRVAEGRWNVVGGWWVEPDMNIPSGEAMARQGLYGQLTIQRLLGVRAKVAFNPDSFGHTGTLPQIIKQQGMENYVFMRPGPKEKTLPADIFWWQGSDGTKVLTYRIPLSYNDSGSVKSRIEQVLAQYHDEPVSSFMAFYGAGDHGGGATKENIQSINELKNDKDAPKIFYSTPDKYFNQLRKNTSINLPVVNDDLQHHAVGCYTAESEIKKNNRLSEAALVAAEKIAAIGSKAWGASYPKNELTTAWQRVLFLQFHDSLAGSSLMDHSQDAKEGHGFALSTAHQAAYLALQKLEWQIAAEDPASQYMIAFNPHAWDVKAILEYDFNWGTNHKSSKVEDAQGNSLLHQWTSGSSEAGSRKKLLVNAVIPAMGYSQIRVSDGDSFVAPSVVIATEKSLENKYLKLQFSEDGTMGILDKRTGKEIFTGGVSGCRGVVINDPSDTWSHDIKTFSDEIGSFGNSVIKLTESGPLRGTIRVLCKYGNSILTTDWSLLAESPVVEAKVNLNWNERLKMLKFSFPLNGENHALTCETPYGNIARSNIGNEDPAQRWINMTGSDGTGLTVINDAKYGYSANGNDLRLTIARSAVYAHHNPRVLDMSAEHYWMDQGIQTFRMLLIPHAKTWNKAEISRLSDEFIATPFVIYQGIHGGKMPKSGSFLSVDAGNIIVTAVKHSENGSDTIIRCVETAGTPVDAEINLLYAGKKWKGKFHSYEIKTLRISDEGGIKEVNLLEE
jgi:alpha-mannosidase